ncbi:MAG TPA: DUF6491 family protein [Gammaproteobacteria bacterium]
MHAPLFLAPFAGAVLVLAAVPVGAQDDDEEELVDRAPERCISLNRVDETEVIDDRTLIFLMRDGGIYLNHLSRECPGLKREERFMYSPTSNRLCDIDTITVLEQWAFGLTRGFTCQLGQFHPISEADLAELRAVEEAGEGEGGFEVVPVDPETLEDDGGDSDAGGAAEPESGRDDEAGAAGDTDEE